MPSIGVSEYVERREHLMKTLSDGVIVMEADKLLPGMSGIDTNTPKYDYTYLAGYHEAGDILVLVPQEKKVFVFTTADVARVRSTTGLDHVLPRDQFAAFAKEVLSGVGVIYTRLRGEAKKLVEEGAPKAELRGGGAKGKNIQSVVVEMRMMKSAAEMRMMRVAADATNEAHLAAMRACRGGMNEEELQKIIEATFKKEGCDGLGFPSIVGSGKNGTVLHYMANNQEMPKESLVVVDIGASYRGYVTDITRTLPTDGKFTEKQREAYQCVLDAQRAAEKILKAGVTFEDLDRAARAVFEERKLTKWSYAHSKEMTVRHGLGHYVGLAVHDSGVWGKKIPEGAVITIEPGYYSKEDGWGIRIEDIYLVTKDGCERWSAGAPREVDEVEKAMKKK